MNKPIFSESPLSPLFGVSVGADKADKCLLHVTLKGPKKIMEKIDEYSVRVPEIDMEKLNEWQRVGEISVNAGLCWLGDPCYVFGTTEKGLEKDGMDYRKILNAIFSTDIIEKDDKGFPYIKSSPVYLFDHYPGNSGKGILTSTGFGDGCYDVFVKLKKIKGCGNWGTRVSEMKVVFIGEEDEECD